jgi:ribosomal protein S18 acetylase RimI-like enzyme
MKIEIKEAKEEDFDSIVKFHMDLADYHKKIDSEYFKSGKEREKQIKKWLKKFFLKKRRNRKILVAKVDGKAAGFFLGSIHNSYPFCKEEKIGEISIAFIDEKFRGQGIGKMLFDEMIKWFKERKMKFVEVTADSRNNIGISAWRKYGFREIRKTMKLNL